MSAPMKFLLTRANTHKAIYALACATANVITLHPKEEQCTPNSVALGSHRRLALVAQFQALELVLTGLQETRMRVPRARGVGPYQVFAAAAGTRGQ